MPVTGAHGCPLVPQLPLSAPPGTTAIPSPRALVTVNPVTVTRETMTPIPNGLPVALMVAVSPRRVSGFPTVTDSA